MGPRKGSSIPIGIQEFNATRPHKVSIHEFPKAIIDHMPMGMQDGDIVVESQHRNNEDKNYEGTLIPETGFLYPHSIPHCVKQGPNPIIDLNHLPGVADTLCANLDKGVFIKNIAIGIKNLRLVDSIALCVDPNYQIIDEIPKGYMDFIDVLRQTYQPINKNSPITNERMFGGVIPFHLNIIGIPMLFGSHAYLNIRNCENPDDLNEEVSLRYSNIWIVSEICVGNRKHYHYGDFQAEIALLQFRPVKFIKESNIEDGVEFGFYLNHLGCVGSYLFVEFKNPNDIELNIQLQGGIVQDMSLLVPAIQRQAAITSYCELFPLLFINGNIGVYDLYLVNFSRFDYVRLADPALRSKIKRIGFMHYNVIRFYGGSAAIKYAF